MFNYFVIYLIIKTRYLRVLGYLKCVKLVFRNYNVEADLK